MKKSSRIPALILLLLLAISFSGCTAKETAAGPDEIVLSFSLDTPDDVYQIAVEYWAGDVFCGGVAQSHANGSRFTKNESHSFLFDPSMFPDGIVPESMKIAVMLSDSLEHLDIDSLAARVGFCDPCETDWFSVSAGTVYHFSLNGSFADGFSITADA
ncbi:MAG: hypothetical protein II672_05580 [Oscillospiraceae bacterium]|nr:hypothetical protein [Oscillospiraceae bacterium]